MIDQAAGPRLKTTAPRERIWSDTESVAWLKAAETEDPHMTTSLLILLHTAQRPGDMLKMTWPQYSGGAIRLRQQKTNKLPDVPIAAELAPPHDAGRRQSTGYLTVPDLAPVSTRSPTARRRPRNGYAVGDDPSQNPVLTSGGEPGNSA